jgi:hypothetical protein
MCNDKKRRLDWLEEQAEKAYTAMYDAPFGSTATAKYSDAKEFLADAIALARELELDGDAERLSARLAHIKQVFRSQFSG